MLRSSIRAIIMVTGLERAFTTFSELLLLLLSHRETRRTPRKTHAPEEQEEILSNLANNLSSEAIILADQPIPPRTRRCAKRCSKGTRSITIVVCCMSYNGSAMGNGFVFRMNFSTDINYLDYRLHGFHNLGFPQASSDHRRR